MITEIVVPILNIVAIGLLSLCAFNEKQRGDAYRQKYMDAMIKVMKLELEAIRLESTPEIELECDHNWSADDSGCFAVCDKCGKEDGLEVITTEV
jgi:hypothetical protein